MKLLQYIIPCFIILTAFSGCAKEKIVEPAPVSATPSIKFISIAPGTAIKYVDEIKITIEYTDGDGDLGENVSDTKNLYCTDSRNNVTYQFRIPQLAPDNANITIKGNLSFNLDPQGFVDDNDNTETATYSIYIKDRAGNQSNTVQTTPLVINKQ
jgi:hypothetical protein